MTSVDSSCTTISVPEPHRTGTGAAQRLPAELMIQVLEQVPQNDLWIVARASRQLYAHALDAGLYVVKNVRWGHTQEEGFGDSLDKLDLVLTHAEAVNPALNISIHADFLRSGRTGIEVLEQSMQVFTAAIQRALPYLVRLHLSFSHFMPDERLVARGLGPLAEAPKLRNFIVNHDTCFTLHVPPTIFGGSAPQLRKVSIALPNVLSMCNLQPIAAFRRVTHLRLEVRVLGETLALAPIFPALKVLAIDNMGSRSTGVVDLRGLALRYLAMWGPITLLTDTSSPSLKDIPVIELHVLSCDSAREKPSPGWYPRGDALCGVVECRRGKASISFGPGDGGWRRTIALSSLARVVFPMLADSANLVSLSVHYVLFNALARAPITLAALRELFVDVDGAVGQFTWSPADFMHYKPLAPEVPRVQCPALARLVLCARPSAAPPAVSACRVLQIGSALGLHGRGRRPTLTLAGCIWPASSEHADGMKVAEMFAAVEQTAAALPEFYYTCRYSGLYFANWATEWDAPDM